jgi:hypothetical protein
MRKLENGSARSKDDQELSINKLSQITGIAGKTAQAMYEIGIHNYADLIDYLKQHTAEEFSKELKEHGVNRRPSLIDTNRWIRQAELLSQAEGVSSTPLESEREPAEPLQKPSAVRERRDQGHVFTVSFDIITDEIGKPAPSIRVYDENNGGKEAIFQGPDSDSWVNWILERANLPLAVRSSTPEAEAADRESAPMQTVDAIQPISEELSDFVLEISDVHLSVIGRKLAIPKKKVKAQINLKLYGADAERLTLQNASFRTEIFAVNLVDGFPIQLGSREDQFKPHVFGYSYQFETAIPTVGRYELHSVVRSLPSGELRAYHRGPIMRVTP